MLNARDDVGIWRSIKAHSLIELLRQVPSDARIAVGPVGNLSVLQGEAGKEEDWVQLGYIDLSEETYEPFA